MHNWQYKLQELRAFLPTALQQEAQLVTAACSDAGRNRKSAARSGKLMPAPPTVSILLSFFSFATQTIPLIFFHYSNKLNNIVIAQKNTCDVIWDIFIECL